MSLVLSVAFVIGVIAGAIYIGLLRLFEPKRSLQLYAVGLFSAALIYVGFAGLNHGLAHIGLEGSGLLIFGVLSWLGARRWPLLLGLGWLVHGGWDFWHGAHHSHYVPSCWPAFCAGIDWIVGAYLLIFYLRKKPSTIAPAKYS